MFWGVGPPGRASGTEVGAPATGGSPGAPGPPGRWPGGAGRLVKGLLPGPRGTLRGTVGPAGPPGRPGTPGRGPAGRVAGAGGAAWAAGANGGAGGCTTGGAGGATTGAGAGATGLAGTSSFGAAAAAEDAAATFAGAAFLAGAAGAAAGAASPSASLSLRTTGGSTVDDADFTNSPRSLSFARTVLLSTPSSLASSWTRAFPATVLLFLGPRLPARPPTTAWEYSSLSAHRVSIRQTHFRTAAIAHCKSAALHCEDFRGGLALDPLRGCP
jgi:hypothetical protein